MTSIIKSYLAAGPTLVRSHSAPPYTSPPTPEEEQAARQRDRIIELEAALGEKDQVIAALREDIAESRDQGHSDGYAEGLMAAEDAQDERLRLLTEAIAGAREDVVAALKAVEGNAVLLARECLDILFGHAGERGREVEDLIRHQVQQIDTTTLVQIEVSETDFPDKGRLDELCAEVDIGSGSIIASGRLAAGDCRMQLKLGRVEFGIDQQWGTLKATLDEIAKASVPS